MRNLKLYILVIMCTFILSGIAAQDSNKLEKIHVEANKFVSESGKTMIFHGVNIKDPHELVKDGKWTKAHFEMAKSWGANIIRLPIHPVFWREMGKEEYIKLLDQAVVWGKELGLYLVIDWHSIGNLYTGKYQNPMYFTTIKETYEFWDIISNHFKGEPVIAMYELFNEPTQGGEQFGDLTWSKWKELNEEMIQLIRKNDTKTVILVAGFNWAYDLTPVKDASVSGTNIAYVSHPYPEKRDMPWEPKWEEDWGFVAAKYPVILTEIGFALPDEKGVHVPVHGDENYGESLVAFCKERGISWIVWIFDSSWAPMMYRGDYEPTRQGAYFKKVMTGK